MKTNLVIEAFDFAKEKHAGQTRKVSGAPYITHPIAVSYIVAAFKRSKHLEELLVASILHDTLEDTETDYEEIERRFGTFVAEIVQELTNSPVGIKLYGKLNYQKTKMLGMSSYSLVIKLADKLNNVFDNPTDKMVEDTIELLDYLSANRKLSKTHVALITAIREHIHNRENKNGSSVSSS